MKMSKTKLTCWALLGLSIVGLAACNKDGTSSSSSEELGDRRLNITLAASSIPEGSTFFDGCLPSVVFEDLTDGTTREVYNYSARTTYTITNDTSGEEYSASDSLPAGQYTCEVRYSQSGYTYGTVKFNVVAETPTVAAEGKGYKSYKVEDLSEYQIQNFDEIETLGGGGMPANGDVKILVIPVEFEYGQKFSDEIRDEVKPMLEEAFFAESDGTPWESLHSYYKKSSYGKLNITGVVTDIYTAPYNDKEQSSTNTGFSTQIAQEAVDWLVSTGRIDPTDYDLDGDGYIDGVEVVYTTQNSTPGMSGTADAGSSGLWWNFTTNTGASPNVASPKVHRIFWTRYDYVTNNYYVKEAQGDPENNIPAQGQVWEGKAVDAHTIIHETGHMMGAPDYYSYDRTEGPAGQVDMMDNNVGDHNAYTKMIYNWVAPRVVDGSSDNFTITLKSFTETGDFLLVKPTADPWNETPYDEYLMLQYYTPTGLNEKDSTGYPEWSNATSASGSAAYGHGGTYEYPGLQVFHVDTRVSSEKAKLADDGSIDESTRVTNYTDTPLPTEKTDTAAGTYESEARRVHDNTPSRSTDGATGENTPFRELQAVFATTTNTTAGTSYYNSFGLMTNLFGDEDFKAKNDTGTKKESYYGNDTYSNYYSRSFYPNDLLWNDGNRFDWTFHVESQTDEEITLHFIKTPADNDAFTD